MITMISLAMPHLHDPDVICSVNLGIFSKFLSQRRHASFQVLSLTRILSLNVRINTGGIQLKDNQQNKSNCNKNSGITTKQNTVNCINASAARFAGRMKSYLRVQLAFNPLSPNITMHFLLTVLYIILMVLAGRICIKIKSSYL